MQNRLREKSKVVLVRNRKELSASENLQVNQEGGLWQADWRGVRWALRQSYSLTYERDRRGNG